MKLPKLDLRHEIGSLGLLSLAIVAAALAFSICVVQPLEAKGRTLAERLARAPGGSAAGPAAPEKLGELYEYLDKPEQTTDWLAKLYAIGHATGVELQSATYRSERAGRIERYQIVLPVSGSYAQMREFVDRALTEIPVLSLDQMSLKRESRRAGAVQAELKLTLHMVAKDPARKQVQS